MIGESVAQIRGEGLEAAQGFVHRVIGPHRHIFQSIDFRISAVLIYASPDFRK